MSSNRRTIAETVQQILAAIPEGKKARKRIEKRTKSILHSETYQPPELQWMLWRELGAVLDEALGDPAKGPQWKKDVARIMTGQDNGETPTNKTEENKL